MHDQVNSPAHYASGGIETIDAIEASMSSEEFIGYLRGNIQKYVWRYRNKGGVQDLRKARWYLDKLINVLDDPFNTIDLSPTKRDFNDVRSQIDGLY